MVEGEISKWKFAVERMKKSDPSAMPPRESMVLSAQNDLMKKLHDFNLKSISESYKQWEAQADVVVTLRKELDDCRNILQDAKKAMNDAEGQSEEVKKRSRSEFC